MKEIIQLEYEVHPFVIFCGKPDITKAYVIVNGDHYEYKIPLGTVDNCFRACVALHTYPKQLIDIWTFVQLYIYNINIGVSVAFVLNA